jgi:photosystem II stability/assembly factor-like uncharacterized protein
MVTEEVPFSGQTMYEIVPIKFSEMAAATVSNEIIDVAFGGQPTCGACGLPSDGCQIVLALETFSVGSPGLISRLVWSDDGGGSWNVSTITSLGAAEAPSAVALIGSYVVVIAKGSTSLHYAVWDDVRAGTETWTEVSTGFTQAPNAMFSLGPSLTWIVCDGGYIDFLADPTTGVENQSAGVVTVQNLNDVHFFDSENGIAVGEANAVLFTNDGGATWAAVTGPAVGVALNACWMKDVNEWFVGTAGGSLYYTRDAGTTWTLKGFPGSGSGVVKDIKFASDSVGYLSHTTAGNAGRILRTIDGGYTWYVLPEGTGAIPTNTGVNAIAVCADVNVIFGGGKGAVNDGFLVKGA